MKWKSTLSLMRDVPHLVFLSLFFGLSCNQFERKSLQVLRFSSIIISSAFVNVALKHSNGVRNLKKKTKKLNDERKGMNLGKKNANDPLWGSLVFTSDTFIIISELWIMVRKSKVLHTMKRACWFFMNFERNSRSPFSINIFIVLRVSWRLRKSRDIFNNVSVHGCTTIIKERQEKTLCFLFVPHVCWERKQNQHSLF